MFYGDLLLPSASMMVEPFSQQHHRPRSLVSELQKFSSRIEILGHVLPALPIQRQGSFVRRHQLRDQYALNRISRRKIDCTVSHSQASRGDAFLVIRVSNRQRVDGEAVEPLVPFVCFAAPKRFELALWLIGIEPQR